MTAIFITGTDTEVGKTYVTVKLIESANQQGFTTFGIKPIASGALLNSEGKLRNDDALRLQAAASVKKPYPTVNPFCFSEPIAPHLAAKSKLDPENIKQHILSSIQPQADFNFIEGAGGWALPLGNKYLLSEIIVELNIPVILVIGMRLGCLNHAILTYKNMQSMGAGVLGWIANCIDPNMPALEENIEALKEYINRPCLAIL